MLKLVEQKQQLFPATFYYLSPYFNLKWFRFLPEPFFIKVGLLLYLLQWKYLVSPFDVSATLSHISPIHILKVVDLALPCCF